MNGFWSIFMSEALNNAVSNAVTWFEIGTVDLDRAEAFYTQVLGRPMRPREPMGPSTGSVFGYAPESGVGGCLMQGVTAPRPSPGQHGGGTLVYLHAAPSLSAALGRVEAAGGHIALPTQKLPPGMGFFAHIVDPDGNRVGLHALAE
jgi:uncharacterized protein